MKKVRIKAGQIGLVFRKDELKKVIKRGYHRLGLFDDLVVCELSKRFVPSIDLSILLEYEELRENLDVIEVADNEIVIQYESGNFNRVLTAGEYAFWKDYKKFTYVTIDLSKPEVTEEVDVKTLARQSELHLYIQSFGVKSYEQGVLIIDNKIREILEPGSYYFWKTNQAVSVETVDLRQQQLEVSGQEILTKDKAALRINFFTQYRVVDVSKAVIDNKEYEKQLYILMQFALREYIGKLTLDNLLENKEGISEFVMETLKESSEKLGVEVCSCGVRDVILPGEMKEIMNQVLIAQKKAQANVITRREETASTRSLLNTAKLMEENDMLLKLKEMEYVEKIAEKVGEITLSGNGQILSQLKGIFAPDK
ncbi:slipin family protein [Halocola ammonii]